MNRRGFLDSILKAGIGAAILPAAVTYARTWKRMPFLYTLSFDPTVNRYSEEIISYESLRRQFAVLKSQRDRNGYDINVIEILTDSRGKERLLASWAKGGC